MSNIKKKIEKYEDLVREDYFQLNQQMSSHMWDDSTLPTVFDIAEFIKKGENEKVNAVFDFFDNKEDFLKMANKIDNSYEQEESSVFIKKVMSANNEDISKAGYFYKLLMASADDFRIKEKDCEATGKEIDINDLNEELFNYKIRFSFVVEYKNFVRENFEKFQEWCKEKELKKIHVRSPLECNFIFDHNVCKKCAGTVPSTPNIGVFTALMVTEHATQSALSSMNKGKKENINDLLSVRYDGKRDWEEIKLWIENLTDKLYNEEVSSRFYEIALLSRVRQDKGYPFVASLKSSIDHSKNLFGAYIFNPNHKKLRRMLKEGEFEDNSLKLQIAINNFKKK